MSVPEAENLSHDTQLKKLTLHFVKHITETKCTANDLLVKKVS